MSNDEPKDGATAIMQDGSPRGGRAPVKVNLPAVKVKPLLQEAKPKLRYFIGATDECPPDVVHVAGLDFPKMVDPPRETKAGEPYRDRMRGKIVRLDGAQVEKIRTDVVNQYFRKIGKSTVKQNAKNVNYVPQDRDLPVAKFLFMKPLDEKESPNRALSEPCPETMA